VKNHHLKLILFLYILILDLSMVFPQSNKEESSIKNPRPDYTTNISEIKNKTAISSPENFFVKDKTDSMHISTPKVNNKNEIKTGRLALVSGVSLAFLGGFYYRMKTAWWNNGTTRFHFEYNGVYVKNIDKVGHMYGAILFTEGFGLGLKWAGMDDESSLLYGGLFSTIVYAGIEVKDGFAPGWGFDPVDMASDLVGAVYPFLQYKISFLQDFNFKWSYWPSHSPYYTKLDNVNQNDQFFTDDYEGQTFWLSMNVKNYLPNSFKSSWPNFLNIAAGLSVKNIDGYGNGDYIVVISPDLDLQKLFESDNELLNSLFHYLNCIHIPLPALEISPRFKAFGFYLNPSINF
jgi:Predicted periplasmic lipoprotein (DUF2279)